jgi:hypothetical protein
MDVTILATVKLLLQLYLTRVVFLGSSESHASYFCRSTLIIMAVLCLMYLLILAGMALTVNMCAVAYFFMQPGNVVPLLNSEKYEICVAQELKSRDVALNFAEESFADQLDD